jgi:hypothetical protein
MEGLMAGLFGGAAGASGKRNKRDEAQDLMYDAWDSTGRTRVDLARRALEIDPDCADARDRLHEAVKTNQHVPAYLLGKKRLPRTLPDYVGFGDEDEAVAYASESLGAWKQTPSALDWLAASAGKLRRPRRVIGGRG